MSQEKTIEIGFADLNLSAPVLKALDRAGYETPTPIQAKTIPVMLSGKDLVGQAQTGTGKTAAFACPLLTKIDLKKLHPQVLVLAPTRELAIQVAETFQRYAHNLKNFHVLPIYGGQGYSDQLRRLKRGVHVIVGTPGRVMDHMRRGSLKLDGLTCLVLDEADEMLRMGFIDDVEWILEQTPGERQIALFSATMPKAIRQIAQKYLKDPEEITIKVRTATADTINQRYWMVSGLHKLDALTRILEAETFDGVLIFVRTRSNTVELAEKLEARGYAAEALNGDIVQKQRERTVERLRKGKLNILVATDVAARGLDVDRISHVINYDIPYDTEAYIHRIGRTGRAGRSGEAILFVSPRERRMLRTIERATNQRIKLMELPSTDDINDNRIAKFKQQITDTLAVNDIGFFYQLVEQYRQEQNVPAIEVAAALAKLVQGDEPLLLTKSPKKKYRELPEDDSRAPRSGPRRKREASHSEEGMERFRISVGHMHDVKPGNIVGAIANEAGIDAEFIGRIDIFDDYSTVDLPSSMPSTILTILKRTRISGQQLNITPADEKKSGFSRKKRSFAKSKAGPEKGARAKRKPRKK
ncbi:MAG: ATP-dependent helicase [Calditrichaeota bacterium]|nr:MAG: ATP-dependent helicase [Calditrichota bacterium]